MYRASYAHANDLKCRLMEDKEMWHHKAVNNGLPHPNFCKTLTFEDPTDRRGIIHFVCPNSADCSVVLMHPEEEGLDKMLSKYGVNE